MALKLLEARQEAKLNMLQVVTDLCDANSPIVAANVAFNNSFLDLKAKSAQISAGAQTAGAVLSGIAVDKSVSKQDLSQTGAKIAGLIYAYAAKNGNNTLKQAVNFSVSDLLRLRDGELAPVCQNIHDRGVEYKDQLVDYAVTTAKLADFQSEIDGYAGKAVSPRTAITGRKVTKANIKQWFKDADFILFEQMDKMIDGFAEDHPDFVAQYKAARIIIDPKTGKKMQGETGGNPPA